MIFASLDLDQGRGSAVSGAVLVDVSDERFLPRPVVARLPETGGALVDLEHRRGYQLDDLFPRPGSLFNWISNAGLQVSSEGISADDCASENPFALDVPKACREQEEAEQAE